MLMAKVNCYHLSTSSASLTHLQRKVDSALIYFGCLSYCLYRVGTQGWEREIRGAAPHLEWYSTLKCLETFL